MRKILSSLTLTAVIFFSVPAHSDAFIINFDEFSSVRDSFAHLGINNSYHGFKWTFANSFDDSDSDTGWALASTSYRAAFETATPVSGDSYGWNWNGPQSLFIEFDDLYNVNSAHFAKGLGQDSAIFETDSIQLYGYKNNFLVSTSGTLNLSSDFNKLDANFSNIDKLEIRADRPSWFLVDDISLNPVNPRDPDDGNNNAVPEPATFLLLGGGLVAAFLRNSRTRRFV